MIKGLRLSFISQFSPTDTFTHPNHDDQTEKNSYPLIISDNFEILCCFYTINVLNESIVVM